MVNSCNMTHGSPKILKRIDSPPQDNDDYNNDDDKDDTNSTPNGDPLDCICKAKENCITTITWRISEYGARPKFSSFSCSFRKKCSNSTLAPT